MQLARQFVPFSKLCTGLGVAEVEVEFLVLADKSSNREEVKDSSPDEEDDVGADEGRIMIV